MDPDSLPIRLGDLKTSSRFVTKTKVRHRLFLASFKDIIIIRFTFWGIIYFVLSPFLPVDEYARIGSVTDSVNVSSLY